MDRGTVNLSLADYLVAGGVLLTSMLIGLYHSRRESLSSLTVSQQFFTGAGRMNPIPVGISLLASYLSSITLLGQPAEIYQYGPQNWMFGLSAFLLIPIIGYIFAPFFRKQNCYSIYGYLGSRYSKTLERGASLLISIQTSFFMAAVVYAPALAIYQVTEISPFLIATVMYVVCIFYTTIGGIKAVVWSDTFQVFILFSSTLIILCKGTSDIGGPQVVWKTNQAFNRTNFFNWELDFTKRYTVWSSFFGSAFLNIGTYGGNQLQVQRYLAVKTNSDARKMLWISAVGWTSIILMTTYAGLLMFATYAYCDPIKSQRVNRSDELFAHYSINTLGDFPGLSGLFFSGLLSAALSTVSTGVNSITAIWYSELSSKGELSERVIKLMALTIGVISYTLVYAIPYMGSFVQITVTLSSVCSGSLFGIFVLAIYFPSSNTLGASVGLVSSISFLTWLSYMSVAAQSSGFILSKPMPTSILRCPFNTTFRNSLISKDVYAWWPYRVSFLWYALMGMVISFTVGLVVSSCRPTNSPRHRIPEWHILSTFGRHTTHQNSPPSVQPLLQ